MDQITRFVEKENNDFIDMMEDYFNQPFDVKLKDARPEYGYQVHLLHHRRAVHVEI